MKCVLITGGSRGIGRAICLKFAEEKKYHILINYTSNDAAAEEVLKLVHSAGAGAQLLKFDVADYRSTTAALQKWQDENPEAVVEVIVNNAGISRDGLFMWMSENDWSDVIGVSLNGFFNVTRFFIDKMLRNRFGRIINIVSLSGQKGNPGQVNYSAAKAGIIGATKALALEVAKRKITVNAIAPGFIKTDMTAGFDEDELKPMIPANRFGTPEEVADLVSFIASEKASYITGEVLSINGGVYS